jgi:phage gpG-like protein
MASAGFSIRIVRDDFTPAGQKLKGGLSKLRPVLEAVGLEVVSITQRAFRDESLRAAPWPAKRDGSPATLIESGALRQSIRVVEIGSTTVTVGSDRIYAAIHQLGGTIVPKPGKRALVFTAGGRKFFASKVSIPPRPYFPITESGDVTELAAEKVMNVFADAVRAYLP